MTEEEKYVRGYEIATGKKLVVPQWLYDILDDESRKFVIVNALLPAPNTTEEQRG